MFRLFLAIFRPNKEPEFRYIKCALYFTIFNYELFYKRNRIPLGAHFIYLNSGSLLGLKMAKK